MPSGTSATKYIFVTGGVVSSLGKGIAAASLGRLLVERGLSVTMQKFDPYINVDPGTMSPFQHGEVFVTDDGAETDLDGELADGLEHRQRLDVAHGATDLGDHDVDVLRLGDQRDAVLDLVGDVRDDLHRAAQVVAAALLTDHRVVDGPGRHIGAA